MDPALQLVPDTVIDVEVNAVVIIFPVSWVWGFSETGDSAKKNGIHSWICGCLQYFFT